MCGDRERHLMFLWQLPFLFIKKNILVLKVLYLCHDITGIGYVGMYIVTRQDDALPMLSPLCCRVKPSSKRGPNENVIR